MNIFKLIALKYKRNCRTEKSKIHRKDGFDFWSVSLKCLIISLWKMFAAFKKVYEFWIIAKIFLNIIIINTIFTLD